MNDLVYPVPRAIAPIVGAGFPRLEKVDRSMVLVTRPFPNWFFHDDDCVAVTPIRPL